MKGYRQNAALLTILIALCCLLVACSSNGSSQPFSSSSAQGNTVASGTQGVRLYVEPDDGEGVITDAISGAHTSVWVEMYLLSDKNVINALEEAAHNGVTVRVMLEAHPYGSGSISPQETLDKLQAAGVQTETTNPQFALTHEKGMVIDGQTAYIMTSNFTQSALGVSKYTLNREYGIIDSNAKEVQAVKDIFQADWNRQTPQINDANLVVSPVNSRASLTSIIQGAKKSLRIEAEEMQDSSIEQAIVAAKKRGVHVQVILPTHDTSGGSDSNATGINAIKGGDVEVKEDAKLYMHAKIIVADDQKAFVGSENISTASLEHNRELGIILSDAAVITKLEQTFQTDWDASQAA